MAIGDNIRARRLELHMTQQEIADALGLKSRSSIAKIEKNKNKLSPMQLQMLANLLRTSVDGLLAGEFQPTDSHMKELHRRKDQETSEPPRKKNVAVILAGGKYRVNKYSTPFQFVAIREKPIVIYTMEAYQRHPLVDEIYVACLSEWGDYLQACAEQYNISKFVECIPAGELGILSVKNVTDRLSSSCSENDIIILQESTRPFVDSETISNAILCCKQKGSGVTFTRLEDTTPFLLSADGKNIAPVDAYSLITIQSPEVYSLNMLKSTFEEALKNGYALRENAFSTLLFNLGKHFNLCEGSHNNLRIVSEDDLKLFEALLQAKNALDNIQ